jgi:hypothetical protein
MSLHCDDESKRVKAMQGLASFFDSDLFCLGEAFQIYAPRIGSGQFEFSFALRQGLSAPPPAKAASAPRPAA